jgi:hypothetical protein
MPDHSGPSKLGPTFDTLAREQNFRKPPKNAAVSPILNEFVAPHIESFNALFDDSGLPAGDTDGRGLLSIAIKDIGERVVFDGKGEIGLKGGEATWGNRLSSKRTPAFQTTLSNVHKSQLTRSQSPDPWSPTKTKIEWTERCSQPK